MEEYKIPQEHQSLPPEHTLPEEFSTAKPVQAEKKKSTSRRWMAMIAATFMTMQLMFTYFVPPTDPSKQDPPIYTEPGLGGPPDFNVGDFNIHAMPSRVDDTWLREGLQRAGEYFEDLDYIRAAVTMQNALFEYRMDYNTYDLDHVGYAFHNSTLVDFDGYAVNGFYFYFEIVTAWLENKIGELEPVEMLDAYIVSFAQGSDDTYYRVLHVTDELSEYMLYGMSYDWVATFTYTEGTLDDAGNSARMTRTMFDGNNISANPNVDGMYEVYCYERLEGPVGGYAFLNETKFQNFLVYNDAIRDFELDEFGEQSTIYMQVLTEDGRVDLDHPAVLDATGGMGETTWDDFRADTALDLLAGENFVSMKAQINRDHEVQISNIDYADPLLPLDMTVALSVQSVVEQVGGIPTPFPPNDAPEDPFETDLKVEEPGDYVDVDVNEMQEYLADACQEFLTGSYIQASLLAQSAFRQVDNRIGFSNVRNSCFVWENGKLSVFDGQDLRDGSGVYIYFMPSWYYYSGKEDDGLYSSMLKNMTMLVSEKTADVDYVRLLNLCATGEDSLSFFCNAQYFETVFRKNYRSDDTTLFAYHLTPANLAHENTAQGRVKPSYMLQGQLLQDAFVGNATYYFGGSQLNSAGTELVPVTDGDKISLVLTDEGGLYIDAMELLEYNNESPNGIFDMLEIYENDPTIPGYVYNFEQYSVVELRCDEYPDKTNTYWKEVPTYDVKFFSTERTIEYWRMLQQHMN